MRIHPGHAKAHYDLANALARQGELDTAVVHFRQALFFAPQDARAHYNLGQIFVRQGKLEEAIQHYRLALRIDPAHVKAHYYLAVALAEQGDFEGAGKEFQESLRIEPNLGGSSRWPGAGAVGTGKERPSGAALSGSRADF